MSQNPCLTVLQQSQVAWLSTALPLGVFFLDSLGVLLLRRARIIVQHTLLDQRLWRRPVRNLLVERVRTHVLLELQTEGR